MATTSPLRQRNRRHDDPQPLAGDPTILHLRGQKVQPAFHRTHLRWEPIWKAFEELCGL